MYPKSGGGPNGDKEEKNCDCPNRKVKLGMVPTFAVCRMNDLRLLHAVAASVGASTMMKKFQDKYAQLVATFPFMMKKKTIEPHCIWSSINVSLPEVQLKVESETIDNQVTKVIEPFVAEPLSIFSLAPESYTKWPKKPLLWSPLIPEDIKNKWMERINTRHNQTLDELPPKPKCADIVILSPISKHHV